MAAPRRLPLRFFVLSTAVALVAALATYAVLSDGEDDISPPGDRIDLTPGDGAAEGAVDATFTTFEGDTVTLSSLRGAPVLVNFFASTCVPCVTEMPALEEVHQQLGDQVRFLGLAMQDRPEDAEALVERTGITYPAAQDKDGSAIAALGGTVLPTTVLLDAEGRIVETHSGQLDADQLRSLLADKLGIDT